MILIDFSHSSEANRWQVVNDGVMGGFSKGQFTLLEDGVAQFSGHVSLDNNGGFSSVRRRSDPVSLEAYDAFLLRIKGDGKIYQLRVKSGLRDRHTYIYTFPTSGEWQIIRIPFRRMTPNYRGRKLPIENFQGIKLSEVGFLIGNKKEETFKLLIDRIELVE